MRPQQRLAQNVLYGCGASTVLMLAPQLPRVPLWESAVLSLALLWKLLSVWRRTTPPQGLMSLLAVILAAGVFASFGTFVGRTAGTALLLAMLVMKYLEARTARDATLVIYLSYFVVVTNFLFNQSILMAAYLMVSLTVCTLTLLTLHTRVPTPTLPTRTMVSLRLMLEALPIALVLFVLFPRISGPLWGVPEDRNAASTGLSDTMTPGMISSLSQSAQVAFRVKFDDARPPYRQLYWRGPVLWHYDGRTWSAREPPGDYGLRMYPDSSPVRYTITMQPHGRRWVFALDAPAAAARETQLTRDLQLLSEEPLISVRRYQLSSYPRYHARGLLPGTLRAAALQLPQGFNPQTRALAAELSAGAATDAEVVTAALDWLREGRFDYTLSPPLLGENAMDDFLFRTRQGFCEHFASAFVTLMRAAGVPARIVTGYLGGETNILGDYLLVRQSDAHAWAEVWLDGRGWVRVDPTAMAAPGRIEGGLQSVLPDASELPFIIRPDNAYLREAALLWDSFNNRWNEWVLGYGPALQRQLFGGIGLGKFTAAKAGVALVLVIAVLLTVFALAPRLKRGPSDPVLRQYLRFCAKLARAGLPRADHEGPLAYAARARRAFPQQAQQIDTITRLFVDLFYGDREEPGWRSQLLRETRALRMAAGPGQGNAHAA